MSRDTARTSACATKTRSRRWRRPVWTHDTARTSACATFGNGLVLAGAAAVEVFLVGRYPVGSDVVLGGGKVQLAVANHLV
jgi:hypothetical protein